LVEGGAVPIRDLLKAESAVFGPEELKDIVTAFEAVMKDMGLTDRTDPSTIMLAKLTIELAKQGEFTAASLRARVLEEMGPKGRPN
jgi:hypothetical protein